MRFTVQIAFDDGHTEQMTINVTDADATDMAANLIRAVCDIAAGAKANECDNTPANDEVTADSIRRWAESVGEANSVSWQEVLRLVMEKWKHRTYEAYKRYELIDILCDYEMHGLGCTSICDMCNDELLNAVLDGPVTAARDNWDEDSAGKPFGLTAMIESNKDLWCY